MKYFVWIFFFIGCTQSSSQKSWNQKTAVYWNDGMAEVASYHLEQNRYDAIHEGEAILITVKEDFLPDKQVKNETYTSNNSTPILKRIETRSFNTGAYTYHTYSSAFTPFDNVNHPHTFKITSSIQDWCGHTFLQYNRKGNRYRAQQFSYFEKEGDINTMIKAQFTEEELLTRLRMDPQQIPTGEILLIPHTTLTRLKHWSLDAFPATVQLSTYSGKEFNDKNLRMLYIEYPDLRRKHTIVFENDYPHHIVGWIDEYPSAFDGKIRKTKATLKAMEKTKYWKQNGKGEDALRKKLQLNDVQQGD